MQRALEMGGGHLSMRLHQSAGVPRIASQPKYPFEWHRVPLSSALTCFCWCVIQRTFLIGANKRGAWSVEKGGAASSAAERESIGDAAGDEVISLRYRIRDPHHGRPSRPTLAAVIAFCTGQHRRM